MERVDEIVWGRPVMEIHPLRLLLKALILYLFANLAFAYFDPPIGKLSIYNWLVPGRERVPYEREVDYYLIAHTVPVYEDMDAMYASHLLSRPKQDDEFRVILLGDSSTWGFELHPHETLAGLLNSLRLEACDGRRIVVYNAAFPLPYAMKDLLVMDKVRQYAPDLYLWTVTLDTFRNRSVYTRYFLVPYAERVYELVEEYEIRNLDTRDVRESTFWEQTIIGQRALLKRMLLLQLHGLGWSATGLDYYYLDYPPLSVDQKDSILYDSLGPGELDLNSFLFDVLGAAYEHAGDVPLLVVNEPIFIASGINSDIRYNDIHPRWAYDEYLEYLDAWMMRHDQDYINAWNAVPSSEFTNMALHRTPQGEKILAEMIVPKLEEMTCTK
jgi:hypothetical protein